MSKADREAVSRMFAAYDKAGPPKATGYVTAEQVQHVIACLDAPGKFSAAELRAAGRLVVVMEAGFQRERVEASATMQEAREGAQRRTGRRWSDAQSFHKYAMLLAMLVGFRVCMWSQALPTSSKGVFR